jgi:hypothetical protein
MWWKSGAVSWADMGMYKRKDTLSEEGMVKDFAQGGALLGVCGEDLLDEIAGVKGDTLVCGKLVLVVVGI